MISSQVPQPTSGKWLSSQLENLTRWCHTDISMFGLFPTRKVLLHFHIFARRTALFEFSGCKIQFPPFDLSLIIIREMRHAEYQAAYLPHNLNIKTNRISWKYIFFIWRYVQRTTFAIWISSKKANANLKYILYIYIIYIYICR